MDDAFHRLDAQLPRPISPRHVLSSRWPKPLIGRQLTVSKGPSKRATRSVGLLACTIRSTQPALFSAPADGEAGSLARFKDARSSSIVSTSFH